MKVEAEVIQSEFRRAVW